MYNRPCRSSYNRTLATFGVQPITWSVLEEPVRVADHFFLNGVPGLSYPRGRNLEPSIVYAGACRPHLDHHRAMQLPDDLGRYRHTVLVSQGTVDNVDPGKLMIPTIQALSDTPCLVIVATGGHGTDQLRRRWDRPNVVIVDWIDFDTIMPRVDLFVCNGGSGSLLASLCPTACRWWWPASVRARTTTTRTSIISGSASTCARSIHEK